MFLNRSLVLTAALALTGAACHRKPAAEPPPAEPPAVSQEAPKAESPTSTASAPTPAPARLRKPAAPVPPRIWEQFSGERAMEEVAKQVALGPRPAGSPELEQVRVLITNALTAAGWDVVRQEFTDQTPRGPVKFVNLIGRFSATTTRPAPATTQRAIVCSHYDTKRFSTIRFVGASDGASSTGALIELARALALDPALASKVELVFFDGEEAFVQFTESDGLYGSRFYARSLRETSRAAQFQFGILWDMIGDRDLTITLSPDSPQPLTGEVLAAADALSLRPHFAYFDRPIWDDHVPLNQAKIPTVDLIDFDYLPWHTADDTLDKLAPESLRKVGAVTLFHLRKALP